MMWPYKKKGFTLLELMIVVIIVGILASLAIPRFIDAAARARRATATQMLASIRGAQMRYYAEYNAYTSSIAALDLSMSASTSWPTITAGAGSAASMGSVTSLSPAETYTIAESGTVSGP